MSAWPYSAEVSIPQEAPVPAPPPNARAVAASGDEVVVTTAAGDLWLVWSGGDWVGGTGNGVGSGGGNIDVVDDVVNDVMDDVVNIHGGEDGDGGEAGEGGIEGSNGNGGGEGGERGESERGVGAVSISSSPPLPPLPRALIRGHSSSAHFVAWHPRREGVFAVAAGAARIVLRHAGTRAALGIVYLTDPHPGRACAVAFSPAAEDDDSDRKAGAGARQGQTVSS
jgi:hypothetical protein